VQDHKDSNAALNARAFTTGQELFFRPGQYKPEEENGKRMLAHELTHIMQQR
jgi:hypothetical protein